jgi:hypothetical protein
MMREYPMTFDEFVKQFSTEEQCEYIGQKRAVCSEKQCSFSGKTVH